MDNRLIFPFSTNPDPNYTKNDDLSKSTKLQSKKVLRNFQPQNVQKIKKVLAPTLLQTFLLKKRVKMTRNGQAKIYGMYAENIFRKLVGTHPQVFSINDICFLQDCQIFRTHQFFLSRKRCSPGFGHPPSFRWNINVSCQKFSAVEANVVKFGQICLNSDISR